LAYSITVVTGRERYTMESHYCSVKTTAFSPIKFSTASSSDGTPGTLSLPLEILAVIVAILIAIICVVIFGLVKGEMVGGDNKATATGLVQAFNSLVT
jgi:hypothetical protein